MASTDLVPASSGGSTPKDEHSALSDLLKHSVVWEKAGAVMPRDLVQFGFLGAGILIVAGLVALVLPDPSTIRHGQGWLFHWHFFLVFRSIAAGLDSFMHALAVPAIVGGLLLMVVDAFLLQVRTSEHWRVAIYGQAGAAGIGASLGGIFLAVVILNLAIFIAVTLMLIALGIAVICALLAGLFSG